MLETERDEIIQYGIEREKIILVSIAIILGLGCVFDIFYLSIIFSLAFCALRRYAGGYHAKTQKRCYVISLIILIMSFIIMKYISKLDHVEGLILLMAFCCGIIWHFAPIENKNKSLDELEQKKFQYETRKILVIESIISLIAYVFDSVMIFIAISIAIVVACIVVVVGIIQIRIQSNN
ncbi:MAG: accessory gene regulator B family protein [Lachnospiraceae bacterium]|nr:accessory gene regulator B family protein [Lachnospiraceae bacterium]MDD6169658.1 accessory gene regulator B family protein [Lachnospiraceae bacterium]